MVKEKNMQILRGICVTIALATGVLSMLYLLGIVPGIWIFCSILGLGILFHGFLSVLLFFKHRLFFAVLVVLAAVFYFAVLVYYIF